MLADIALYEDHLSTRPCFFVPMGGFIYRFHCTHVCTYVKHTQMSLIKNPIPGESDTHALAKHTYLGAGAASRAFTEYECTPYSTEGNHM